MLRSSINKLLSVFIVLQLFSGSAILSAKPLETVSDTRKLLAGMEDVRTNNGRLAALLRVGDKRIPELVRLLDDQDPDIRLRAQVIIRYLGNESGMRALREWYDKQKDGYVIAGPIPLPLAEWDYNFIEVNLLTRPPQTWRDLGVQYIYALALDKSPRANALLRELFKRADGLDESDFIGYAIKQLQTSAPANLPYQEESLERLVLNNAFFIAPEDRKYTSTRLLGFNTFKDKVVIEVYINRGRLAEEWYHVVLSRDEPGWKFFSISPVGIS